MKRGVKPHCNIVATVVGKQTTAVMICNVFESAGVGGLQGWPGISKFAELPELHMIEYFSQLLEMACSNFATFPPPSSACHFPRKMV